MATQLGKKLTGNASPPPVANAKTLLANVLAIGPRGELVELPMIGPAWVMPCSIAIGTEVEGAVERRMAELRLQLNAFTAPAFESQRAVETLARCVRTTEDHEVAVGTIDEWLQLDAHTISRCWAIYADVVERLAPLDLELDQATRNDILSALAKKNTTALRSFGLNALVTFLLSMESPPADSPRPMSSGGESSRES